MSNYHRLIGIASGAVDQQNQEIKFEIAVSEKRPISFVAKFGPASQLVGALGRMISELRRVLDAEKKMETVFPEVVAEAYVKQERWSGAILVEIVTPQGIPYIFAIPSQIASDIADRLKTESSKYSQVGMA